MSNDINEIVGDGPVDNQLSQYCASLADVEAAYERINGIAHKTPVLTCSSISDMISSGDKTSKANCFFKVEALQKTGSFKFRGALNAIQSLISEQDHETHCEGKSKDLNVVTHSSGNHAQALALAAKLASTKLFNVNATIVMPDNAPSIKKRAVEGYGAEVVLVQSTNEAREAKANEIVKQRGSYFIHPSEDPRVIAGQGTVCLEFVSQVQSMTGGESLDIVIIPVGGGGLASGCTTSLRGLLKSKVTIVLAEPLEMDDAKRSFESGKLLGHYVDNKLNSIADGLKTTLGPNTWPIIRDMVSDVITVSEKEILMATKLIWERLKICIEPSAGVGAAVAMSDTFKRKFLNVEQSQDVKNIGIVLCGGNVDVIKIATLMKDL